MVLIARDLVNIAHIRAKADADVSRIDAETRAVVARLKIEVERTAAQGDLIRNKGEAAAKVIEATLKLIPEGDTVARALAMDTLKTLVIAVTGDGKQRTGSD